MSPRRPLEATRRLIAEGMVETFPTPEEVHEAEVARQLDADIMREIQLCLAELHGDFDRYEREPHDDPEREDAWDEWANYF